MKVLPDPGHVRTETTNTTPRTTTWNRSEKTVSDKIRSLFSLDVGKDAHDVVHSISAPAAVISCS